MNHPWHGLIDDAALFPPEELPMSAAVPAHFTHQRQWYADLLGPFVVPMTRLFQLSKMIDGRHLRVNLNVPGGEPALDAALHDLNRYSTVRLAGLEIPLADSAPGALVAKLDRHLAPETAAYVEVPSDARAVAAVDTLIGSRHRAKFRTGGTVASAFPTEKDLAAAILACAGRGVPLKCTAGLHHAIRHTDHRTGFEHHGFLNVLIATAAALDAAPLTTVAGLLTERNAETVAKEARDLADDGVTAVRHVFTSIGSCSVRDPLDDLLSLGLLAHPTSKKENRDDLVAADRA
ncbi:hypothetical protein ABZ250_41085 [Streptomyces afghaniensis]|uniref:hypothetical protein n=1 Tax=Streptomyces afghaniensis TaxID=66865 RepID=UPI0033B31D59